MDKELTEMQKKRILIINSWILYKSIGGETPLVDFTVDIIRCLLRGVEDISARPKEDTIIMSKLKSLKFVDVPLALKSDGKHHWLACANLLSVTKV